MSVSGSGDGSAPLQLMLTNISHASALRASLRMSQGSTRYAITVDGTESDDELSAIKQLDPAVVLLKTPENMSRIHASRRVFEASADAHVRMGFAMRAVRRD